MERHQAGADLTEVGRALVADAEAMERAAQCMRQTLEVHRRGVAGTLRVTMSELTANAASCPCCPSSARRGLPAAPADLKDHSIVAGEGDPLAFKGLGDLLVQAPEATVTLKSSSTTNLFASIRAGVGVGPMPTVMAGLEADLIEVFPPRPQSIAYTRILTRPERKDAPRVRAFIDYFPPRILARTREAQTLAATLAASRP